MAMYQVDVVRTSKLAEWCDKLQGVAIQKLRGSESEHVKELVERHNRRLEESLDEDIKKGLLRNETSGL
jgi:hypothetical protein